MRTVLITGANRGLGLGMVKYLTKQNKVEKLFATCRNTSDELQQLMAENKNLHVLNLEATNPAEFDGIATQIAKEVGDLGLNLLINNAGITTKFTKLNLVRAEQLMNNFTINTVAPIMLTRSLLTPLKQAAYTNSDKPLGAERAAVLNISSILGSIDKNDQGGFYPYRCSKAALNAATKSMSLDLKKENIVAVCMHPGWVKTDMGGKNAPLDVETSITGIFTTIANLGEAHNGKFLQYDGKELPW